MAIAADRARHIHAFWSFSSTTTEKVSILCVHRVLLTLFAAAGGGTDAAGAAGAGLPVF